MAGLSFLLRNLAAWSSGMRPVASLFVLSALVMGSAVQAAAPEPTLEVERVDDRHVRIQGRGFSQAKLELELTPERGGQAPSPCSPYALKQLVAARRGTFDVTLEADEGCLLACGADRHAWTVTARLPEGEAVVRTEPFGCEPWPLSEEEARIRKAWKQLHPGKLLPPACHHEDLVRVLQVDVDESPGVETVLASRRLGLFVLGAQQAAAPLAWKELHCEGPHVSEEDVPRLVELTAMRASGLSPMDLVLHTRRLGHCGGIGYQQYMDRQARTLTSLVEVEVFKHWQCWNLPQEDLRANVESPSLGRLRVKVEGTRRVPLEGGELGPPVPFQSIQEYRLQGRKFVETPGTERR